MIRNLTAAGLVVVALVAAVLTTVFDGMELFQPSTLDHQRGEGPVDCFSMARKVTPPSQANVDVAVVPDNSHTARPSDGTTLTKPALDAGSEGSGTALLLQQLAPPPRTEWYEECYTGTHLLRIAGRLANGKREGTWLTWYESGALESLITYQSGELEGPATMWRESGVMDWRGGFSKWGKEGCWCWYHPDGSVKLSGDYAFGFRAGSWSRYAEGGNPTWLGSYVLHTSTAQLVESLNQSGEECFDTEEGEQGIRCGVWTFFDSAGNVIETKLYHP